MILFFADVHSGINTYSKIENELITTSELDTRIALDCIYERSKKSDIDLIICGGDFFHSSHPTTENIRWFQDWLYKMDTLNKPFYLFKGNHDASLNSSSLVVMESLKLNNIFFIDDVDFPELIWNSYKIKFIPYIVSKSAKNKYESINDFVAQYASSLKDKTIIVTHVHESEAKMGSESRMLSKSAEVIDLDETKSNAVFLCGHIHAHQIYKKRNGITICYPGSLTYLDLSDCNQRKGYVVIDESGNLTFEDIIGIRKFKKYNLPADTDPIKFLESFRLTKNDLLFLYANDNKFIDEDLIRKYLKERSCGLGKVIYPEDLKQEVINIVNNSAKPDQILKDWLIKYIDENGCDIEWIKTLTLLGMTYLKNEV